MSWTRALKRSSTATAAATIAAPVARDFTPQNADDALMMAYARGKLSALDELVARYRLPLLRFAYRVTGDESCAEDVVQETFVRVMQKAQSYSARGYFKTWLFTIAANLCKDELKRRTRHNECSLDFLDELQGDSAPAVTEADALLRWQLSIALQTLPTDHRMALVLHHCQQFSYDEIGEVLGCPAGTVKSRVHYALQHLRKVMRVQP